MPPQREDVAACEGHAVPSILSNKEDETAAAPAAPPTQKSYWEDQDTESMLKGKTLSMLDMTAMESNHPDRQQQKKDDYWEATAEKGLEGKTLSTPDMTPAKCPPSPTISVEEPDETPSYWDDAPIDKSLEGKRLSSIDLKTLSTNHPDHQKQKEQDYWGVTPKEDEMLKGKTLSTLDLSALRSNHPDEHQQKRDDYWGGTPKEDKTLKGRTLSTLEMSALESNHPDEKKQKGDSYWEAPEEDKLKGKRLSTIDMKTLETTERTASQSSICATEDAPASAPSYWDEAPIEESLKGKRLSSIDMAAMNKQHAGEDKKSKTKESSSPYWDWKGVKGLKKTLSKLSLSNLRKGSSHDVVLDEDDRVHGGTKATASSSSSLPNSNSANSMASEASSSSSVKPITQKKHRLRDTWRRSFQRLSSNTLDQLDESSGSHGPRLLGKRIFKTSKNSLDWSSGSRNSTGSIPEDAIMF